MRAVITNVVVLICLALIVQPSIGYAQAGNGSTNYKVGWDNYKPSDLFVKSTKQVLDLGYIPKDSLNVITVFSSIDSSDVGSTILSNNPQFRKVIKVWSIIVRDTHQISFPTTLYNTKRKQVNPFVGVEQWVFANADDAIKCMDMLRLGMVGSSKFNIHHPPREFARVGNDIYYFYTFPTDFYPNLVRVRDIFMRNMSNPDFVK